MALSAVTEDMRQALLSAAGQLDKGTFLALLKPLDSTAPALADHLRVLAETYRFDLAEDLLTQKVEGAVIGAESHG